MIDLTLIIFLVLVSRSEEICGGEFNSFFGNFQSENYPNFYPNNANCTWTITVDPTQVINFEVTGLNVENHAKCLIDYLEVRENSRNGSILTRKRYCGSQTRIWYLSHTNILNVSFVSDKSVNIGGFAFKWNKENIIATQDNQWILVIRNPMTTVVSFLDDCFLGLDLNGGVFLYNSTKGNDWEKLDVGVKGLKTLSFSDGLIASNSDEMVFVPVENNRLMNETHYEYYPHRNVSILVPFSRSKIILVKSPSFLWGCMKYDSKDTVKVINDELISNFTGVGCNMYGCYGWNGDNVFWYFYINEDCEVSQLTSLFKANSSSSIIVGGNYGAVILYNDGLASLVHLDYPPGLYYFNNTNSSVLYERQLLGLAVGKNRTVLLTNNGILMENNNKYIECGGVLDVGENYVNTKSIFKRCLYKFSGDPKYEQFLAKIEFENLINATLEGTFYTIVGNKVNEYKTVNTMITLRNGLILFNFETNISFNLTITPILTDEVTECGGNLYEANFNFEVKRDINFSKHCNWSITPSTSGKKKLIFFNLNQSNPIMPIQFHSYFNTRLNLNQSSFYIIKPLDDQVNMYYFSEGFNTMNQSTVVIYKPVDYFQCFIKFNTKEGTFDYPSIGENFIPSERCQFLIDASQFETFNDIYMEIELSINYMSSINVVNCSGLYLFDGSDEHSVPLININSQIEKTKIYTSGPVAFILYDFLASPALPSLKISWRILKRLNPSGVCELSYYNNQSGYISLVPPRSDSQTPTQCISHIRVNSSDSLNKYLYMVSTSLQYDESGYTVSIYNEDYNLLKMFPIGYPILMEAISVMISSESLTPMSIYYNLIDKRLFEECNENKYTYFGENKVSKLSDNFKRNRMGLCDQTNVGLFGTIMCSFKSDQARSRWNISNFQLSIESTLDNAHVILYPSEWMVDAVCNDSDNSIMIEEYGKGSVLDKSVVCSSFMSSKMELHSNKLNILLYFYNLGNSVKLQENIVLLSWNSKVIGETIIPSDDFCGRCFYGNDGSIILNEDQVSMKRAFDGVFRCTWYITLDQSNNTSVIYMAVSNVFFSHPNSECSDSYIQIEFAKSHSVIRRLCTSDSLSPFIISIYNENILRIQYVSRCSSYSAFNITWKRYMKIEG